jgi:hypothetical protein
MRRPVLLIFINAMILIVVFMLMTQSLVLIQRIARTENLKGNVEVRRAGRGEFSALAAGDMIKTGDVIRSGTGSTAEFKWADGTRWKIMPGTEITVAKSTHNAIKKADQSQLKLSSGKVFIRIVQSLKPASQFQVETPTAVAAVRGTIFSVEYKNGQSEIAVFKGAVQVKGGENDNDETLIRPGVVADSTASGALRLEHDPSAGDAFEREKSIVLPELDAKVEVMPNGRTWVSGQTENGDRVLVNGRAARVLGNGTFRQRVSLKSPDERIAVVAIDKHGAQAKKLLDAPADAFHKAGASLGRFRQPYHLSSPKQCATNENS